MTIKNISSNSLLLLRHDENKCQYTAADGQHCIKLVSYMLFSFAHKKEKKENIPGIN